MKRKFNISKQELDKAYEEREVRVEAVRLMCMKLSKHELWDTIKARDIPQEIMTFVHQSLAKGRTPDEIRAALGIKNRTSREWHKIAAALKLGRRVNSPLYFERLLGRNERLADKLYKVIDQVLDADVDFLKDNSNQRGDSFLKIFSNEVTPMIDAMNRLQQGTVKIGRDLGVFADPTIESKGGGGGVTIIVKSNVLMKPPEEILKEKKQKVIEAEIVESKDKVPSEK